MTKQHWLHTSVLAVAEHYWHSIKVLFYFSFFLLSSYSEEARGAQEHWRGHKQNSWSKLIKGIFHNERCHTQQEKNWGKEKEGRNSCVYILCLPKRLLHVPCFMGNIWTSACQWETVDEFPVLLCLLTQLLFYLANFLSQPRSSCNLTQWKIQRVCLKHISLWDLGRLFWFVNAVTVPSSQHS